MSTIWFDRPAPGWNEALPIGNGRLGAMVFGRVPRETLELNEESIWARCPGKRQNPAALRALPEVRRLIIEGKPSEAEFMADSQMMGAPSRLQPYQPLGRLEMCFLHQPGIQFNGYRRSLDLSTALATVEYSLGDVKFQRRIFASAAGEFIAIRVEASKPREIGFILELTRQADAWPTVGNGMVRLSGRAGANGTRFEALAKIFAEGGELVSTPDRLTLTGADAATIIVACGTDFHGGDPLADAERHIEAASSKPFDASLAEHLTTHRRLFERSAVLLESKPELEEQPSDQRLKLVKEGGVDEGLAATMFDYGRYLLICSSRPAATGRSLPANLQGIWNPSLTPPWNSDFHTNINLQMNYWLAEPCNLSECHGPLFEWMEALAADGAETAKIHYNCRGWVAHHISDPWGFSVPGDHAGCGLWPTGGAWLCDHLWEHYLFSGDREFLRSKAWPLMIGACRFFLDYLVEDAESGQLLCGPSVSPENRYRLPNGAEGKLCMGATMDSQILRELFSHTLAAAAEIAADDPILAEIRGALPKLPPNRVGTDGRLLEWEREYEESEPGHRHISHLWGLHPGEQIAPDTTPELAEACRKTIEGRLRHGGGHTGWSAAWLLNMFARLGEGEKAHSMLLKILRHSTLPNLFDDHPPFQIDGNFGVAAGIAEMLLQSRPGLVNLLPALPPNWNSGSFRGLRARGGLTVAAEWENGSARAVTITADRSQTVRILLAGDHLGEFELRAGEEWRWRRPTNP